LSFEYEFAFSAINNVLPTSNTGFNLSRTGFNLSNTASSVRAISSIRNIPPYFIA
jgi:hypothetical protein